MVILKSEKGQLDLLEIPFQPVSSHQRGSSVQNKQVQLTLFMVMDML